MIVIDKSKFTWGVHVPLKEKKVICSKKTKYLFAMPFIWIWVSVIPQFLLQFFTEINFVHVVTIQFWGFIFISSSSY